MWGEKKINKIRCKSKSSSKRYSLPEIRLSNGLKPKIKCNIMKSGVMSSNPRELRLSWHRRKTGISFPQVLWVWARSCCSVFNVYKIYKRFKLLWDTDSKSHCQNCCLFLNETYKCYLKPIPAGGTFCSTSPDCYQGKLPCGRAKDRKNIPFS